ncbi:acetyl ornithine aminotransferase family protein [Occallatibacter riparius]|uniref:Acetyl ornithine aminotransferase family protein n=1 Tax=Occallatibacter riparius TaxID=1002689 RepID=A0A9J7BSE0_9BACT|nr:acetyl ornithine aminotransferase family protein [Occallatibacter riparius]UWZ85497.1 acetyl ornithine aminotransferase family protein [Occallatibacter riparius]
MTDKSLHEQYGPKLVTELPGPKAKAAVEADDRLISPSYTRSYPLVAKSGKGVRVTDVDGNEFLDFSAGIAVTSTGHCHPEVVAAIQKQAAELIHISGTDFYNEPLTDLAAKLSAVAPMKGPHRFFYGNSGAEAVECAMKLARYHTERQNIIAFLGAFHGRTMGALSLTASKPQQKRRFAPLVPGVTHVRYPYAYRGCTGGPQEEEAFALGCARYIEEKLFKTILPPEEVAAIFVEPIQGEGGYVVAPANFMRELRAICDKYGILLVVDEVQSGAGRTGKWWAVEHTGVEPDIVCMAKGIASGMPLGICMSRAEIMDWVPGSHASTFGGNPVSLAAALATIDVLQREGIANAARVGRLMLERLNGWKETHPLVGDVRGRGLMIGIELVKDRATRVPATALRNRVETLAFERGLMILGCGETSIRLCPPLIVSEEEATVALDILEEALTIVEKEHSREAEMEMAGA